MKAADRAWSAHPPAPRPSARHPIFGALDAVLREDVPWTPSERLVAVALTRHLNARGEAWPSQLRLARRTRLSERTVRRALDRLCGEGGLFHRTRRGRHDRYALRPLNPDDGVSATDSGQGVR